jgi:predicted nucleic acid-binding Zn ribbon protein
VRRRAPRPLSAFLPAYTAALAPASMLARVQTVWELAAGPAIAASARPTSERDGVLTVTCVAAVWTQELDLMADELVAKINSHLPGRPIRELRCRTG